MNKKITNAIEVAQRNGHNLTGFDFGPGGNVAISVCRDCGAEIRCNGKTVWGAAALSPCKGVPKIVDFRRDEGGRTVANLDFEIAGSVPR